MSVLKLIPEHIENNEEKKLIIASAMLEVFIFSIFCVIVIEWVLPYIVTENKNLLISLRLAVPGLVFFSLNKVSLNYLNGLSEMKAYAFFQSLRYIVIVFFIYLCGNYRCESIWLSFSFTIAEIIVFLCSQCFLVYRKLLGIKISMKYVKEHIKFGTHILPANMVVELNTKVDIICLGIIIKQDYLIGIYSFAIIFVEGFYQLYIIVRRSINPKLTEYYAHNELQQGVRAIGVKLKKYLRIFSPLALVLLISGYCIICYVLKQKEYIAGVKFIIIICGAIAFNGKQIVLGNFFSQIGVPIYESLINLVTVMVNFLLNLVLIYLIGLWGAAIATAISHMVYGYMLQCGIKKRLNIEIK